MNPTLTSSHDKTTVSPRSLIAQAIWFGMITGYAEVVVMTYRHLVGGGFINQSRDFVWHAPVAYSTMFLVGVPALLLLERLLPRRGSSVAPFIFASVGALGILALLFYGRLHLGAILLLAIGVGVMVARIVAHDPNRFQAVLRRTVPPLALATLILAVALPGARAWREHRAMVALGPTASSAPNVLLLILDTVRARSLSLYGHSRPTSPNLEALASKGVVFEYAIATSPWTLPSHASMFTGRYPDSLSASWRIPLDASDRTLAEAFSNAGYATGGFVANLIYATFEEGLNRGFIHYEDHPLSWGTILRSTTLGRRIVDARSLRPLIGTDESVNRRTAADINHALLEWVDDVPANRPFFAFLNYYDAHDPYLPPNEYFERIAGRPRPNRLSPLRRHALYQRASQVTPEEVELEELSYEASIAYLDDQIGQLLQALDDRGQLDNTLVIVTSDHGEEFGEHGTFYHGHTLYLDALHVPLIFAWPGHIPSGHRVTSPASLRDLAATIGSLALGDQDFPGHPLTGSWQEGEKPSTAYSFVDRGIRLPDAYAGSQGDLHSVVQGRWHYLCHPPGTVLFDIVTDPLETLDRRGDSPAVTSAIRWTLDSSAEGATHGRPTTTGCRE
jgi:arylsulfatase A-like enzyme